MKNPNWQRDELIIALDLYFTEPYNDLSAKHPKVIEVSKILNKLGLVSEESKNETFRNPEGVYMKLGNFLAIDPSDQRAGLPRYGKLDEEVFKYFLDKKEELATIATIISNAVQRVGTVSSESAFFTDEDFEVKEGRVIFRLHKFYERESSITKRKKHLVLEHNKKLECEVCSFDFYATYGELGFGFAECHHLTPVSEMKYGSTTKIKDLAIVCSNCHRMLHRRFGITIDSLREILRNPL